MTTERSLTNATSCTSVTPTGPWWKRVFATPEELGYLPHVWLLFLGFFLLPLLGMKPTDPSLWICLGALVIFIPCYYAAFRREGRALFAPMAVIALFGATLGPINVGSNVFFHYASFFAGQATTARRAVLIVVGFCAWILLTSWLFEMPSYYYGPGILVSLGLVGISIHERQRQLADSALRRSQEEVHNLAQLAERERIARDLHDVVGHTLSMITLKAELASKLIESDPARGAQELLEIAQTSRDALSSVRETVSGYRRIGLIEQIDEARAALASGDVTLSTDIQKTDLKPRHESMLALLVREAVTNVIRHANASECHISLRSHEAGLELVVQDNGTGFDGDEGQGLTGMRERLAALNGQLSFEYQSGTRLTATVPFNASS